MGCPLSSLIWFLAIMGQHLQFAWRLQGTVFPDFLPSARDFSTDSMLLRFGPVFLTNWNNGLEVFLKEFVCKSSSSWDFKVFTSKTAKCSKNLAPFLLQ